MPRLTNQSYLLQHHQLRDQFLHIERNNFVMLSPNEQWDLFSYFLPHEQGSDEELLEHRANMTDFDRSLPHRAGRAYAKLQAIDRHMPAYLEVAKARPKAKKGSARHVSVFSAVNPQLDPEQFAKILIRAAMEQARKDSE